MAESLQLDKAAALVGKSEVTLRRLIKAGKIPFEKEKTLTGFIYRVKPADVRAYYKQKDGDSPVEEVEQEMEIPITRKGTEESVEHDPADVHRVESRGSNPRVRVAIADETGNSYEYWQKKSEVYEEKYNQEVTRHAQTREELGVWRGRAEQAHSMLLKLLPAPGGEVEVRPSSARSSSDSNPSRGDGTWVATLVVSFTLIIIIIAAAAVMYFKLLPK